MGIKAFLRIAFSAAILVFIFSTIDVQAFLIGLSGMNPVYAMPALLIIPVSFIVRSYRLKVILNKSEAGISLMDSVRINLIGTTLNIFMPASSGDIAKAYYGYRRHSIREAMLSSVLVDKLVAILAILVLGTVSSLVLGMAEFFITFLALTVIFYFITYHPRVIPWGIMNRLLKLATKKSLDSKGLKESYRLPLATRAWILLVSLAGWVVTYIQLYLITLAFSVQADFFFLLAIAPLITLARLFPLTFIGLGSQEALLVYLFGLIGITATLSVLISLSFTVFNLVLPGIFGLSLLRGEKKAGRTPRPASS